MTATLRSEASAGVRAETPQNSSSLASGAQIGRKHHIWSSLSAWLMFCWALIELPVELWVSTTWREAMALSCAKYYFLRWCWRWHAALRGQLLFLLVSVR